MNAPNLLRCAKAVTIGTYRFRGFNRNYTASLGKELTREELLGREGFYILVLGAGVPSDHLSTPTRNTAMGGKFWSWG